MKFGLATHQKTAHLNKKEKHNPERMDLYDEAEFIAFIHSDAVFDTQKTRYLAFFKQKEYIHKSKASSNDDALLFI